MPVPSPNKGEVQADFISRCMRFLMGEDPKRDKKQALAIAYSQWRTKEDLNNVQLPNFHSDFRRILHTFIGQYGEAGVEKFDKFIEDNGLKLDKAYTPQAQFRESFNWTEPLISRYKQDKDAVYYKVVALTANVSMNNNDYSNYQNMQTAAPSLAYRPVNINHDPKRWLPFPRTRVDFTKAEDLSIEATLRVDNEDAWLQRKLDNGEIAQASIEARPDPEGIQHGYGFMGIALLERGVELPGDPLTEISPMFLNEKIGESMCKLINGKLTCNCNTITKEGENKTMSEVSKELSPPNTVTCPFCGQIDPLTGEDPAAQKCSKCGHGMRQTPNQDAHIGLQGGETKVDTLILNGPSNAVLPPKTVEPPVFKPEEMIAKMQRESAAQKAEQIKLEEQLEAKDVANKKLCEETRTQAARISDLDFDLKQHENKLRCLTESYDQMHKDFLRVDTERKFAFKERDESLVKLSSETTAKMNALREQSGLQVECAEANERVSKVASENLDLTRRLAEYSRKINERDVVLAEKTKLLTEKDAELTRQTEKIKKALKFQNWAWRELQRAGVAVVESVEP